MSYNILHKIFRRVQLLYKISVISVLGRIKNIHASDQILIFSDPRGGSTWLAEIIKSIPHTAIIWEPLHIGHISRLRKFGFGWRQYIPEEMDWPEVRSYFELLFAGRIINEWTMLQTSVQEYKLATQFIVKICRGNMLIPWIVKEFNLAYLPIYLVRHPFAVVNSQLKQGGWNNVHERYKICQGHYNDQFLKHKDFLEELSSKEEILTANWCITNKVPLSHPNNNKKWITVYYEDLLLDPSTEINRIFRRWELPIPMDIENSYREKSITTSGNLNTNHPELQLSKWSRELTDIQIHKMTKILKYFNIEVYSDKRVTPII